MQANALYSSYLQLAHKMSAQGWITSAQIINCSKTGEEKNQSDKIQKAFLNMKRMEVHFHQLIKKHK